MWVIRCGKPFWCALRQILASLCKKAIMCSLVGRQGVVKWFLISAFFFFFLSTKFYYGGRPSLKRKKKNLKSEMCFVFYQMYHVLGKAEMRISKEEKKNKWVQQFPLHQCSHSEAPKDEIPPWKVSRDQILAGVEAKGLASGKTQPCFLLKAALGSWGLVSFSFLSL